MPRDGSRRIGDDLPDARAFDDDVRCEVSKRRERAAVICGAEVTGQLRLRPIEDLVKYMHLQLSLPSHERGEQSDRTRAGDQD